MHLETDSNGKFYNKYLHTICKNNMNIILDIGIQFEIYTYTTFPIYNMWDIRNK